MSISNSYAQNYEFTFEEARKKALKNAEDIKLQEEMISSLKEKEEKQSKDYTQNNPDYEYHGIQKIPVYTNSYKTYDYKKMHKNARRQKRDMIIANEKKTMSLFTEIVKDKKEINTKILELESKNQLLNQADVMLKTGMITQVSHQAKQDEVDITSSQIQELKEKLNLDEKKFKQHLNLDKDDEIELKLIEPNLELILPEDAVKLSQENKSNFEDLKEDLRKLNDDMKWIERNYGIEYRKNVDAQQKLIDKKKEDIDELKKETLHKYDKIYYDILIKANEIQLDKINKAQMQVNKHKMTIMYNKGYAKKISIDEIDTKIEENLLSQIKKQLEIRWLVLNYELDIS